MTSEVPSTTTSNRSDYHACSTSQEHQSRRREGPTPLSQTEVLNTLGLRGSGDQQAKLVTFTPAMSERLVKGQLGNRPIRRNLVLRYADVMTRGEWCINGETIKFDRHGGLIDGQHRLLGGAAAKKPFQSWAVYGLDRNAFDTIDVGARRTFSDILALQGEQYTASLGATLMLLWRYRNRRLGQRGWAARPEPHALLNLLRDEADIRDDYKKVQSLNGEIVRASVAAFCYHVFKKVSVREADHFVHVMKTGEGRASDPWHRLRERFLVIRKEYANAHMISTPLVHLTFQAWVAALRGDKSVPLRLNYFPRQDQGDFPTLI